MPDKIDPPHATGAAAKTVEAHSEPHDLVFYAPFVQRVWIALEEKKLAYQYVEINPYLKEGHFLAINPKGLVPAIEYKGKLDASLGRCRVSIPAHEALPEGIAILAHQALYESLVLLEFLDDAFPGHSLRPADPHEAGVVRLASQQVSNVTIPAFYKYVQAQSADDQRASGAAFVKSLKDVYQQWFIPGATWARGSQFGHLDCVLAPWIARFGILERHRAFRSDDLGAEFKAYAARVLERPSVKATSSENDKYDSVYARYLTDTAESEVAKATRKGEWLK
ncbi:SPOSA6832_03929 [Sporobolomyces salmonicolor]|uniref:SPOSA6832_03929-mRNA-1:cds n=1 Tax=Sporidiobolus salmonicolor TaxID=5005 RepID=A0A0D6EQM7_SPOSA|nr:SPOSA6832_03929 [Sporobolomyces salmonicolor]